MQTVGFEQALTSRVDDMIDACTKCGKCFEVCPIAEPAGLGGANAEAVVSGVLDILRFGSGPDESQKWAKACMASGECIKACDYGVNPRFLLTMARLAMMRHDKDPAERRKQGVAVFRKIGEDVNILSRLQLSEESLIRLGQRPSKEPARTELPDLVFYTGCNVLKTPHIALLASTSWIAIGIAYQVMGGPSIAAASCSSARAISRCLGRFANNTIEKLAHSKSGQVISWCPSCYDAVHRNDAADDREDDAASMPFEMTPFMRLSRRPASAELKPHLRKRVEMRSRCTSIPASPASWRQPTR